MQLSMVADLLMPSLNHGTCNCRKAFNFVPNCMFFICSALAAKHMFTPVLLAVSRARGKARTLRLKQRVHC